ncbi:MAG: SBBP repeat-containing protein [bacterium]|nr:SBBP repeat-containing protein [bacterium]
MNTFFKIVLIFMMVFSLSCEKEKFNRDDEAGNDLDLTDDDADSFDEDTDISDEDAIQCKDRDYEKWDVELKEHSFSKIKRMNDGSYIFIGEWHEFQDPWHLSFSMIGSVKEDYSRNWGAIFEETGYGRNFNDFKISESRTIFAAGTADDGNSFWLISFSSTGEKLWEKDWRYEGFEELSRNIIYSLEVVSDGICVAGYTAGFNADFEPSYTKLYFAKTDFKGNLLWEKMWGPGGSLITSMIKDSNENFYLAGYTVGSLDGNENAGKPGDCISINFGPEGSSCPDPFLIKIDNEGNILWSRQFGTDALNIEASTRLLLDENENIYVLSEIQHKESLGRLNVTKFDKSGNIKFNKDYTENGRDNIELGYDIYLDKNGMIIVAGLSREKDIPVEGFILAVDKETGDTVGEKRFYSSSERIAFSTVFENESGLNATGSEVTGTYTVQYDTYPIYKYGVKNIGYFYLDSEPDTTITKGDEFIRETVQVGSEKDDEIVFLFTDSQGNIFVAGNTWGTIGGFKNKGKKDVFVAKYKSDGTLEWSKNYGSTDWDSASSASTDAEGNLIITGSTWGDFEGNERIGVGDIFVMKIDKTGKLLWAETAGSDNDDWLNGMWVDSEDNIYVVGGSYGSVEGATYYSGYGCNAFVGKWKSSGEKEVFKMYGPRMEGKSITGDSEYLYFTGRTDVAYEDQSVFDTGIDDSIIFKLDENLEEQWARIWGSVEVDSATDISVDSAGGIYVTGYTFGAIDGNLHLGADCPGGFCPDAYLTKWDSTGKKKWTRQFGTEYGDRATSIAIDENDGIYVSGTAGKNRLCEIESDIFLIKSDTSGNLEEIKAWGTAGEEKVNSISYSDGRLIISGFTTGGLDDNKNLGGKDGFVTVTEEKKE